MVRLSSIIFVSIILLSFAHGSFELRKMTFELYLKDGETAEVYETFLFFVHGAVDQAKYNSALKENDYVGWITLLDSPEFKTHVNEKRVKVSDFRVMPKSLESCSKTEGYCKAFIRFRYEISPYMLNGTSVNGTGFVKVSHPKPRTRKYSLVLDAFDFGSDNSRLKVGQEFIVHLPKEARLVDINPVPDDLVELPYPPQSDSYSWKDESLANFEFSYEIEEPISSEVADFFKSLSSSLSSLVFGREGKEFLGIMAFLLVFYYFFSKSKR